MKKASLIDHTPGTGELPTFSPGIPRIMKYFEDWHNEHPLYYGVGIIGSNLYAIRKKMVETPDVAVRLADQDIKNLQFFCFVNGAIYASSGRDIWKLDEIGRKWDNIYKDKIQQNSYISTYGVYGDTILAKANLSEPESYSGFVISTDNGDTWEKLNTPNPSDYLYSPTSSNGEITSVRFIDDKLYFFISNNGFVISDNRGIGEFYRPKFEEPIIDEAIGKSSIPFIFTHENNKIIPTKNALIISRDGGKSFHTCMDPIVIYKIFDIQEHNGKYYLLTSGLSLYRSDDLGETWKPFIKSKNHSTYNRNIRGYNFTDDGLWLSCGGFYSESGLFYIKNEDFEDADTVDLYSEKLVRVDDPKPYGIATLTSKIVDSHLIAWPATLFGVYYTKLDGKEFPKQLSLMNSPNMEEQKIGFLDTNSQYIFVGQPEGLYRCPRSYLQGSSVSDKLPFEPVLLYPNPGSDFVNIILNKPEEYKYLVLDNSGREVGNGIIKNNKIDIRQYPVGSYIIKVSSKSDSFTTKFIKQ